MTLEYVLAGQIISSINFAPNGKSLTVREVAKIGCTSWGADLEIQFLKNAGDPHLESSKLQLNANYANELFPKLATFVQNEAIAKSILWWKNIQDGNITPRGECFKDISSYFNQ